MEQRLIDANKIPYDCDIEYGCDKICYCDNCSHRIVTEKVIKEISPVLTIPENPTNGDIIRALFSNAIIERYTYCVMVKLGYHTQDDTGLLFDKDWWNEPYKRGEADADSD